MTRLAEILTRRTERQLTRLAQSSGVGLERLLGLRGGAEPTVREARELASALGLSLEDFIGAPSGKNAEADLLFRRSSTSEASSASTSMLARKVASSLDVFAASGAAPGNWWGGRFVRPENSVENAQRNACIFREVFFDNDQFSPLTTLPHIAADAMNVLLFVVNSNELDGASAILDRVPFVFVSARFRGRMLFTLAHEIGHLVAHHSSTNFAMVDEDIDVVHNKKEDAEREFYANAFASSLLMPKEAVGVSLKTIRRVTNVSGDSLGDIEINYLARIFGVSFWAAARRCEDLDLLPQGGAYALNRQLVQEFGSAERRAEELGLPPRAEVQFPAVPWTLLDSAVHKIAAGELSVGRAATALGVSIEDLYAAHAPTAH